MRHRNRWMTSAAAVAAITALALTGCSAPADPGTEPEQELTSLTVGVAIRTLPAPIGAWFTVAEEMGYWEDEGLDVEILGMDGSGAVYQALDVGQIDVGFASGPQGIPAAILAGADPVAYFNETTQGVFRIFTGSGSDVRSLADMEGKKAGVLAINSSMHIALMQAIQIDGGVDPDTVEFIATGIGPEAQTMVERGDVDLLLTTETESIAFARNFDVREIKSDHLLATSFVSVGAAQQSRLAELEDALIGLGRGIAKAFVFANENPQAAVEIHWKRVPESKPADADDARLTLTVEQLQARLASNAPLNDKWGEFDEAAVAAMVQSLFDSGQIDELVDPAKVFTQQFIDEMNDFDSEAIKQQARDWKG